MALGLCVIVIWLPPLLLLSLTCSAAGRLLDDEAVDYLKALDKTTPIAFYCHHGVRSRGVAQSVVQEGFRKVYNLKGGIDAWSLSVDPTVPRY